MLRLGYKASAEQFAPGELLKFGCIAEEVGFDSVFISDHFQPWRHTGGHAPYSLAWLGALGAKTSRIVMGTSVLTPTFRYHPAIVAQAFGTLGSLFPDRVILGIGTGEALNETPATGMVWPEVKERIGRLKESVTLMRILLSQERVTFEGKYYKTANATIYDRPDTPIPIYIGAGGPQVAKYVGTVADGFICTSGKPWALYTEQLIPALNAGLDEAGRAQDSIDRLIEMKVSFDTDHARAMGDTRHWAALALSADEKHERPGGTCRTDQALSRHGFPAPRLPCPGPGPGTLPAPLWRRNPPPAEENLRIERAAVACLKPGTPAWRRA
jgi:coenzyme F420-dependent glucose-6-phosphate dehydrogenase